ncbi:hypothetical protein CW685_05085 [Macrococcoides caseolyticum]|uniref:hypothetical protein n=1 Tax=Macrococcoides caseolyticum TaxID=69966 RepID=UPI000C348A93|nr:hypothetical protein [Macrococcus caseolyticus]PKE12353.1 hypothetical protein CW685_05085 [Macrococcus caseolyticus]
MYKKLKYTLLIIFSVVYIFFLWWKDGFTFDFFMGLFAVIGGLCVYFYNDSIIIFRWINEGLNRYKRKPQITWISNYTIATEQEESFDVAKEELIRILTNQDKFNSLKYLDDDENTFRVQIETPSIKQFNIDKTLIQEDLCELDFSYKTTLSYIDSKTEFDNSLLFYSDISKKISAYYDDQLDSHKPLYSVKISIEGMNPFYGLVTRKIDKDDVENVSLKFNYGEAEIETNDNILIIRSTNLEEIKKATKEYIALTNSI